MIKPWLLVSLAAVTVLTAPGAVSTARVAIATELAQSPAAEPLFGDYANGHFAEVAVELANVRDFSAFETDVERVLRNARPEAEELAAAFALEAAHAAYSTRPRRVGDITRLTTAARRLLEVGCTIVRRKPASSEFAHRWMLASLSLMEGDSYPVDLLGVSAFDKHLDHLKGRADPGVLALARGVNREQKVGRLVAEWAVQDIDRPLSPHELERAQATLRSATDALTAARTYSNVTAEAVVRLGFLSTVQQQLMMTQGHADRPGRAVQELRTVDSMTADPVLRYLGHLFLGRADELSGDPRSARDEYRRAVSATPGRSGYLALAALDFLAGSESESDPSPELASLQTRAADPWLEYFAGSYRNWPQLLEDMRKALR